MKQRHHLETLYRRKIWGCWPFLIGACGLAITISFGCQESRLRTAPAGECECPAPLKSTSPDEQERAGDEDHGEATTTAFLTENRARYEAAIRRAHMWLDGLQVDPVTLREAGLKGKTKLVEIVDAYRRLHALAESDEERGRILDRVRKLVEVTYTPAYHDMLTVDDKQFKQDATSYLRAALLMEKLGLNTDLYRAEIVKAHPRLNAHMKQRGSHQRMAFHWYYAHFGLEEPFDLAAGVEQGVIARRKNPYDFTSRIDAYHLTHEVFIPYEFGENLEADFFTGQDLAYLSHTLERLTVYYIMRKDADLVAELLSCLRYLKMTDLAVYREGLEYLLSAQLPSGKWGNYERFRKRYGDLVDPGWYLHTTAVTIDALSVAFDFPPH